MKISLVTITQYKRQAVLQLLYQCVLAQTRLPDEWVIVEGSSTQEEAEGNAKAILQMRQTCPIPIIYIPYKEGAKLGALRNRGNLATTCDITVCMDDDDYYPPQRIQHVVDTFTQFPKAKIAGCSNSFFYDYRALALYQCVGFHRNHSTNNAMAWRREYLSTHQHDESKTFGEESSFTNNFTEPMIPLETHFTIIISCHTTNTYDKRGLFQNNPLYTLVPHQVLFTIMPHKMYEAYLRIYTT